MEDQKQLPDLDNLTELAQSGSVEDQAKLGYYYLSGEKGVETNYSEAVKWLTLAATAGNVAAQNNLAYCYNSGLGVTRDYSKAMFWLEKATAQGAPEAALGLSEYYLKGIGIAKDLDKGFTYVKEAAEKGFVEAQFRLGRLYYEGIGCEENKDKALEWLETAADQGHQKAANMAAFIHIRVWGHNTPNVDKAIKLLEKTANQGDAIAQTFLGEIYFKLGKVENAKRWIEEAANKEDPKGLFYMGLLYNMGIVVSKDHIKAVSCLKKSLSKSNKTIDDNKIENDLLHFSYELLCKLGNGFYFGKKGRSDYIERDYNKALKYYNKALELIDESKDNISLKIDSILRIAKIYAMNNYWGITRLLFSRAKWLSLLKGDKSKYTEIVIYELYFLLGINCKDEAEQLLASTLKHYDDAQYGSYRFDMTKNML